MNTTPRNVKAKASPAPKARYIMRGGFLGAGKTTAVGKLAKRLADQGLRVFGLEKGGIFSEKVLYIYHKQIEEADLVVISKSDLLDKPRLEMLRQAIAARFPGKEILAVSARNGTNLDGWFARLTSAELSFHLDEPVTSGQLIINLRAEAAPDVLGTVVREGLAAAAKKFPTLQAALDHLEHYRPGKPTPTHRMEKLPA